MALSISQAIGSAIVPRDPVGADQVGAVPRVLVVGRGRRRARRSRAPCAETPNVAVGELAVVAREELVEQRHVLGEPGVGRGRPARPVPGRDDDGEREVGVAVLEQRLEQVDRARVGRHLRRGPRRRRASAVRRPGTVA